jgi:hypothetical protein
MLEYFSKIKITSTSFYIKTTISFPLSRRVSRFLWQGIPKVSMAGDTEIPTTKRLSVSAPKQFFVESNQLFLCKSNWS